MIALPTVSLGFNDAKGSWKIICMSFLSDRSCLLFKSVMSFPSYLTIPDEALSNCRIAFPKVDFPQPDSPTKPSVSPG